MPSRRQSGSVRKTLKSQKKASTPLASSCPKSNCRLRIRILLKREKQEKTQGKITFHHGRTTDGPPAHPPLRPRQAGPGVRRLPRRHRPVHGALRGTPLGPGLALGAEPFRPRDAEALARRRHPGRGPRRRRPGARLRARGRGAVAGRVALHGLAPRRRLGERRTGQRERLPDARVPVRAMCGRHHQLPPRPGTCLSRRRR
ncbi:hypothetical protein CTA2_2065 [Colletotrichum tanaceti]|nr:hypothetical protein CTA2_2065 [Colletotrichum tanaceti]